MNHPSEHIAYRERLALVQWHLDKILETMPQSKERMAIRMARDVAGNKVYSRSPHERG